MEGPKKIQYVTVESNFVDGSNNTFSINFDLKSNIFIQEMKDVCGIRLVDFYVTQIGDNNAGTGGVAKIVDIVCPDIPVAAQLLDARKGRIFARIPIERSFSGSNSLIVHDKQWKGPYSGMPTRFFNPISIKKLSFQIFELRGDNSYELLQPDASWFMVLEIHTVDHEAPKPDRLAIAIEKLSKHIQEMPAPQIVMPVEELKNKKKIPLSYVLIPLLLLGGGVYYYMTKRPAPVPPPAPVFAPVRAPPRFIG